jgi:hypothetical protein
VDNFACVTDEINLPEVINLIKGIPNECLSPPVNPVRNSRGALNPAGIV